MKIFAFELGLVVATTLLGCAQEGPSPAPAPALLPFVNAAPPVGPTGVKECDALIEQTDLCLSKMEVAERAEAHRAYGPRRQSYVDMAATPAGRTRLPTICKGAFGELPARCK